MLAENVKFCARDAGCVARQIVRTLKGGAVRIPRRGFPILAGVLAYVALRPVLGLGHELVVVALAQLGHLVAASGIWDPLIRLAGLDPIYAGAAVRAAGG